MAGGCTVAGELTSLDLRRGIEVCMLVAVAVLVCVLSGCACGGIGGADLEQVVVLRIIK